MGSIDLKRPSDVADSRLWRSVAGAMKVEVGLRGLLK